MLETVVGVVIGGVLGVIGTIVGQVVSARSQKDIRQREELLPVASRALRAAEETWTMLLSHAVVSDNQTGVSTAGITADQYMVRYTEAKRDLDLALGELSLLVPNVSDVSQQLQDSVKLGKLLPGRQHDERKQEYNDAREALQQRVREFLKTQ